MIVSSNRTLKFIGSLAVIVVLAGIAKTLSRVRLLRLIRKEIKLEEEKREEKEAIAGAAALKGLRNDSIVRNGITELIGETPTMLIHSLSRETGCQIVAKLEHLNPGGSPKDRVAQRLVAKLGIRGPGHTVYEGSVGSTGISLCLAARAVGAQCHIFMPSDQAREKRMLIRALGGQLTLTPAGCSIADPDHYVNRARAAAAAAGGPAAGAYFADQFESPHNAAAHRATTGPELWRQCGGRPGCITAFVASAGSGGTLAGVGCALRQRDPAVQVWLADPPGSALFNRVQRGVAFDPVSQAEGSRARRQVETQAEGVGADRLTANFRRAPPITGAIQVTDAEARAMARRVAREDGLFIGSSSAVNLVAAVSIAKQLAASPPSAADPRPITIATIINDSGNRHFSRFWATILNEIDETEQDKVQFCEEGLDQNSNKPFINKSE